jgi:hypothetical protein
MRRLLLPAAVFLSIGIVLGLSYATGLHEEVIGDGGVSCAELKPKPSRHRTGPHPRTLAQGLQRRACGFAARVVGQGNRAPQEFDYVLIGADRLQFPGIVDSNSPAFWSGDRLHLFNSAWEETYKGEGESVQNLDNPVRIELPLLERPGGVWLESVWLDPDTSLLYGWYHFEPADMVCLTAPLIGAAISYDLGLSWEDRGIVLDPGQAVDCDYDNGYFTGGNGDFSVILGPQRRYFYFFFTNYAGPVNQQGIGVARGLMQDKGRPGTVFKYFGNDWTEPALGGRQTILFGTRTGWKGPFVESFWGPSVHWNTYINSYVALLNHTEGEQWVQEGVYITFSKDLVRWTEPRKLLEVNDWYPQVVGLGNGETDTVAGKDARLYVGGISDFIIQFTSTSVRSQPK